MKIEDSDMSLGSGMTGASSTTYDDYCDTTITCSATSTTTTNTKRMNKEREKVVVVVEPLPSTVEEGKEEERGEEKEEKEKEEKNHSQCSLHSSSYGWFEDLHSISDINKPYSFTSFEAALEPRLVMSSNDNYNYNSYRNNYNDNHYEYPIDEEIDIDHSTAREDDDNVMLAVTAPFYVLEETLSSQQLWKDSAGQRPPQPVEERAFYEKMWAQNFISSKVNYEMPIEKLAASSPICSSPLADGVGLLANNNNDLCHLALQQQQQQRSNSHDRKKKKMNGSSDDLTNYKKKKNGIFSPMTLWTTITTANTTATNSNLYFENMNDQGDNYIRDNQQHDQQEHIINKIVKDTNKDGGYLKVLSKGDNVFATTVSKSFIRKPTNNRQLNNGRRRNSGGIGVINTVNISIASYRVVESKKDGKYAQFHVIYREGNIRDTVGVWKRYCDFGNLGKKVTEAHGVGSCVSLLASMSPLYIVDDYDPSYKDNDDEYTDSSGGNGIIHLPNALTSWRLLKKRQRWYRCLDPKYLALKVFLLERFLHDILFESSSPKLLRDFVGATSTTKDQHKS